jgi:DNA replicative helicase MCM subunit Mcm2 (Cdc46/Mcm family)
MLVGGVRKSLPKNQVFRNNINISVLSPPDATLKNLYKELKILNPEIIYSNPTISSASGLTASVIRDSETTSLCLESGLFINKNENLLFIENFHGLEYRTQKLITMCMENQEFAINKAELNLTLSSKISILGVSELLPEKASNFQFFSKTKIFEKNLLGKFDLNFFLLWNDSIDCDFSTSKRIILMHNDRKIKRKNNNIWTIQLYLLFVRNLSPLITPKIYDFILRIYLLFKKLFFSKIKTGTEISSRQLETLIRLSEAFGKLTLFSKIQEFHVKAAARIMFDSFFFLKSSRSKKTKYEPFLNIMSSLKKSKEIVEIKFHDSEFIARKILFLVGKKIPEKKKVNFFLKFVQAFFFHFSKYHILEIGVKQIKKLIIILKHLIKNERKIFIIRLFENLKKPDFAFFLNTL